MEARRWPSWLRVKASEPLLGRRLGPVLVAGVFGWLTFGALIARMYGQEPHGAGFDLDLLITGGRRIAAGMSPYEPAMLAGQSVGVTTLFYSYPPPVAQAFVPLASVPSAITLAAFLLAAPLLAAWVTTAIARLSDASLTPYLVFLATLSLLPFWFPFTLAMLFGNLDIFFVALYGLVVVAVVAREPSRQVVAGAGFALAVASIAKLHPAILGAWLVARGIRERRSRETPFLVGMLRVPRSWAVLSVAALVALVALVASLAVGGVGPWIDYFTVLHASTVADLLDPRNLGPAVQIALLTGLGSGSLAPLQMATLGLALVGSLVAAIEIEDPLESLAWAAAASLVVLPVTWFHHFAVLAPLGAAAVSRSWSAGATRRRRAVGLMALTFAIGAIGFGTVAAWLMIPVLIAAIRLGRPPSTGLEPVAQVDASTGVAAA